MTPQPKENTLESFTPCAALLNRPPAHFSTGLYINADVSAETLKVVLRHKDFTTTEKYYGATRAAQSAVAEIYDRLESRGDDRQRESSVAEIAQLSAEELKKLKALLNSI